MDQANRRCTVDVRRQGYARSSFCDKPSLLDAPFPICRAHAIEVFLHMRETLDVAMADPTRMAEATEAAQLGWYDDAVGPHRTWVNQERERAKEREHCVYYLQLNGLIKIGTTSLLRLRLRKYPPGYVLLVTEPGSFATERTRHKQFKKSLVDGQREWFTPTKDLLAHIASLQADATV